MKRLFVIVLFCGCTADAWSTGGAYNDFSYKAENVARMGQESDELMKEAEKVFSDGKIYHHECVRIERMYNIEKGKKLLEKNKHEQWKRLNNEAERLLGR